MNDLLTIPKMYHVFVRGFQLSENCFDLSRAEKKQLQDFLNDLNKFPHNNRHMIDDLSVFLIRNKICSSSFKYIDLNDHMLYVKKLFASFCIEHHNLTIADGIKYFVHMEHIDFIESEYYKFFDDRNNELVKNVPNFSIPNIIMNKLFKSLNEIFNKSIRSIYFNTIKNEFNFDKSSGLNDVQIFQDLDLCYYLIVFENNSNAVNVYSLQSNLNENVGKFIVKRYDNSVTVQYLQLEKLPVNLSGILTSIWLIDILNNR